MKARSTAYVAIGSNMNGPVTQVERAVEAIARATHCDVVARSSLYRTAPVGFEDQADFVNAVCAVETEFSPHQLLEFLLRTEDEHGRIRRDVSNGPRVIDLDLLLYGDRVIAEDDLIIPHPKMHERGFVLVPLAEIAPRTIVPGVGAISDLLPVIANQRVEKV